MTAEVDRNAERRLRELAITNELMRSLTSSLDLPAVLRLILDRVKMLTQAEGMSFLLYDYHQKDLVFAVSETLQCDVLLGQRIALGHGAAGWVVANRRSLLLHDPAEHPRLASVLDAVPQFSRRGLLAVPLRSEAQVFGVIEVANRYDGLSFTATDLSAVEQATRPLADGVMAAEAPALQALLTRVVAAAPAEAVALLMVDGDGQELVVRASRIVQDGLVAGQRIALGQGIAGWVARERRPLRLDDAAQDPRYYRAIATQTSLVPRTMLCVPVLSHGCVLGVIQLINRVDGEPFSEHDLRITQTLADHAALAIGNLSLYRQAQRAAITDDLTELGNTRHFNQVLPEILARESVVSLLVLDLDNFKAVVDTHGHLVGSRTIRQIGQLIGRLIRPADVAARFGGDEFVVILPTTDLRAARAVGEKLRAAIEGLQTLEGTDIDIAAVTASIGVATFPQHGGTAEELFKAADAAMYRVKRQSKNAVAGA